ncbi:MAG: hypothetical protein H6622_01805 [Halobacteriovoraceae bacterium]|nr:hypothetical protein [Halobacteriovoraceae bacterium]
MSIKSINHKITLFICLLINFSCASKSYLGKKSHTFGKPVSRIIWLQIAGFDEEHLALLKISREVNITAFERMSCLGKVWRYNITDLRPGVIKSYFSQVNGSFNIGNSCEEIKGQKIWKDPYFKDKVANIVVGDFENKICPIDTFLSDVTTIRMSKPKNEISESQKFHFQDNQKIVKNKILYDKNCLEGRCYSTIYNNALALYDYLESTTERFLLTITDFSYLNNLKNRNIRLVSETLVDINKTLDYFLDISKKDDSLLVLVTSLGAQGIEFPNMGEDWKNFDLTGEGIYYKKQKLLSPVFAKGSNAENFCSVLNEADISRTIFWTPESKTWYEYFFN